MSPHFTIQQQKILILLQKELYLRLKEYYSQTVITTFFSRYVKVLTYEFTDSCDIQFLESIKSSINFYNKGDKDGVVNNEAYKCVSVESCNNIELLKDIIKFFLPATIVTTI